MFSSFSFRTDWEVEARTLIPLVTAVAVHDAVVDVLGVELGLRWPNDLMVGPDKVGGILVEARDDTVTIGCGMNLYWVEPIQGARGLLDTDPGSDISVVLADSWVQRLVGFLAEESSRWPRREYEAASVSLDHAVSWDGGSGVAAAIADDGALIVETEDGLVVLRAGEVHTR